MTNPPVTALPKVNIDRFRAKIKLAFYPNNVLKIGLEVESDHQFHLRVEARLIGATRIHKETFCSRLQDIRCNFGCETNMGSNDVAKVLTSVINCRYRL